MADPVLAEKEMRKLRLVAWILLVASPVLYLIVGGSVALSNTQLVDMLGKEQKVLVWVLLLVGALSPAVLPAVERFQRKLVRLDGRPSTDAARLFTTIGITRQAFVEAVYIYGLVVLLITGDFSRMLWFYPIGAIWTLVYWPRRSAQQSFIRAVEEE
jgi:hypothetical protein